MLYLLTITFIIFLIINILMYEDIKGQIESVLETIDLLFSIMSVLEEKKLITKKEIFKAYERKNGRKFLLSYVEFSVKNHNKKNDIMSKKA